eukprot:Seg3769.4 transcript_id=Seg3769.4/GoldUCD/mRNA.D3Y31 product="putative transposon-derived protein F54H12.3" protein_id=Seg3769.4/GoldUCD/D3Y31
MKVKKVVDVKKPNNLLYKRLSSLYRDSNFPGAFNGVGKFYKQLKIHFPDEFKKLTLKQVEQWKEHDLFAAKRSKIKKPKVRRSVQVYNPNNIWEGDLVDMGAANVRANKNVRYLLLLVGQFTKKLFCAPVYGNTKAAPAVIKAFKEIFSKTTSRPRFLYTDQGSEFIAEPVKQYLNKKQGIKTFTTKDKDIKCAIVERSIKTLKSKLFGLIDSGESKYIGHLPQIINGINNTAGRITKFAPNNVTPLTVGDVRNNIYDHNIQQESKFGKKRGASIQDVRSGTYKHSKQKLTPSKYKVDDYVLIKKEKKLFRKEHKNSWNNEIFKVASVKTDIIPYVYHLVDLAGEKLLGYFNQAELVRVQLPQKFSLEKTTNFQRRRFTTLDGIKHIEIKVLECHKSISIPLKVFDSRPAADKQSNKISTTLFLYYLKQQHTDDDDGDSKK